MANFPNIQQPSITVSENYHDNVIRSSFEAGYVQTRARFTRLLRTFEVQWAALPLTDYATLDAFYRETGGGADSFDWTHPQTKAKLIVRFAKPLNRTGVSHRSCSVSISLEEV